MRALTLMLIPLGVLAHNHGGHELTPQDFATRSYSLRVGTFNYAGNDHNAYHLIDAYWTRHRRARPWVLEVHGGSWIHGTRKGGMRDAQRALTRAGFQVFSMDYTLAPASAAEPGGDVNEALPEPTRRAEVLQAIRWIRAHSRYFGLAPNRGALYGFSAGGHLALSAGLYGQGRRRGVQAIITVDGVLQPQRETNYLARFADVLGVDHPQDFAGPNDPAVLMYQFEQDPWVPAVTVKSMHYWLSRVGVSNRYVIAPGAYHSQKIVWDSPVRTRQAVTFLKAHLWSS